MNVTELLAKDHEEMMSQIERLEITDIEQLKTVDMNSTAIHLTIDLVRKLKNAISQHRNREEQVFYLALENLDETRDLIRSSYQEHRRIDQLLTELAEMTPTYDAWMAKLGELKSDFKQHVEKEETELFPIAEELLSPERLQEMVFQMDEIELVQPATTKAKV
jgi:hemerythrin-like domain-containing protein